MKEVQRHSSVLNIAFLTAFVAIFATSGFAAGEQGFDGITGIVGQASQAASSTFGTGILWGVSVFAPLICVDAAAFMGYNFAKKKAEQQGEGEKKILAAVLISGAIGALVFCFIVAILSSVMLGSATEMFGNIVKFYKTIITAGFKTIGG